MSDMKIFAILLSIMASSFCAPVLENKSTKDGGKVDTDHDRAGRNFRNNEFSLGDISVVGRVDGSRVSIGSALNIQMEGTNSESTTLDSGLEGLQPNSREAEGPVFMKNIQYVFHGYDIMKGNPLQVSGPPFDLGYTEKIFETIYKHGNENTTIDGRFYKPENTAITYLGGNCILEFEFLNITGVKSYQDVLETRVTLDIDETGLSITTLDGWDAKFSASTDFNQIKESTSSYSNLFTHSYASCFSYQVGLLTYTPPPLTENFLIGLKTLTENYDKTVYLNFIHAFGTHFVNCAQMGSLFGQQSEISQENWNNMVKNNITISESAKASAMGAAISSDSMTSKQKMDSEKFSKYVTQQKIYTIGKSPPADNNMTTWAQEIDSDPAPMQIGLTPITELLDSRFGANVTTNLQKALMEYCNHLKDTNKVSSCSAPGPDPPLPTLPKKRTWMDWSADNKNGEPNMVQECPEGHYVTEMIWSEHLQYGFVDLIFKCSSDTHLHRRMTSMSLLLDNTNNDPMKCKDNPSPGFRQMTGMTKSDNGFINMQAYCLGYSQYTPIYSNENLDGSWNKIVNCGDNQQIVGFQTRYVEKRNTWTGLLTEYYIANFAFECA